MRIPVRYDGTIYELDGGARIEKSSGNEFLDKAAPEIVSKAALFSAFPKPYSASTPREVWELIFPMNFTRKDKTQNQAVDADAEISKRN